MLLPSLRSVLLLSLGVTALPLSLEMDVESFQLEVPADVDPVAVVEDAQMPCECTETPSQEYTPPAQMGNIRTTTTTVTVSVPQAVSTPCSKTQPPPPASMPPTAALSYPPGGTQPPGTPPV